MLTISITYDGVEQLVQHVDGPLEFGRDKREGNRILLRDPYCSRTQLALEERATGRLHIWNRSNKVPLLVDERYHLAPEEDGEFPLPVLVQVAETSIRVEKGAAAAAGDIATISPTLFSQQGTLELPDAIRRSSGPDAAQIGEWLEAIVSVQRSAAGTRGFFMETARAVVDLIGLDSGLVVLRNEGRWDVCAEYSRVPQPTVSQTVLDRTYDERRTVYGRPSSVGSSASIAALTAVVSAPILNQDDEVIGAVYGCRDSGPSAETTIHPYEAQLAQVLATSVATGLNRLEREQELLKLRTSFEQFFSPDLVAELERNPDMLAGQQRDVTVLFCDLRGFSRLSEQLSAETVHELMGQLMTVLSEEVFRRQGAIIDYYGDGLAAMWNAPKRQDDHATLACRAAIEMQRQLPRLSDQWAERVGEPLRLGIGINSGPALVGNCGSQQRLKYGPRGHTVNLAQRVETLTKHLRVPILITKATSERLIGLSVVRRLPKVLVPGVVEPIEVFDPLAALGDGQH